MLEREENDPGALMLLMLKVAIFNGPGLALKTIWHPEQAALAVVNVTYRAREVADNPVTGSVIHLPMRTVSQK